MSDSNIQQQWLDAAAKLRAQAETQEKTAELLRSNALNLLSENRSIQSEINTLRFNIANPLTKDGFKFQKDIDAAYQQIAALETQANTNSQQVEKLRTQAADYDNLSFNNQRAADDADRNATTATEGPPSTFPNAAPIEESLGRTQDGKIVNQEGVIVAPLTDQIRTEESLTLQRGDDPNLGAAIAASADPSPLQQPPSVNDPGSDFGGFTTVTDELGNTTNIDASGNVIVPLPPAQGLQVQQRATQAQATLQDTVNFNLEKDWRLKLSLAPKAKYLYNAINPGILGPLSTTQGVIFPYTPTITLGYGASYDATNLPHTNYTFYNYKHSQVDSINILADFTAQDTFEANYLLAVMHFFRSVTKMFYGKDNNPKLGTPPPLCYLNGFGPYQFNNHAVVVSQFTYTTPRDVDYIRAGNPNYPAGVRQDVTPKNVNPDPSNQRLNNGTSNIDPGGEVPLPKWTTVNGGTVDPTYVPTRVSLSITVLPIVTRSDITNNFSLQKYATGELLLGSKRKSGGGIW